MHRGDLFFVDKGFPSETFTITGQLDKRKDIIFPLASAQKHSDI